MFINIIITLNSNNLQPWDNNLGLDWGRGAGSGGQLIGSYMYGYVSLSGTQFLPSTVL